MCTTKIVVPIVPCDARTDEKCAARSFAELTLHNFGTFRSIPPDLSLTAARNRLPVAGKRFLNDGEVQTTVISWLQI